ENEEVEHSVKIANAREREKQQWRREAAEHRDRELNINKASRESFVDEAREPRADSHREEIDADDEGELCDGVAEDVACERARKQLVDQSAGRDDENVEKE